MEGSIAGPALFKTFIDDMELVEQLTLAYSKFADDTKLGNWLITCKVSITIAERLGQEEKGSNRDCIQPVQER